MVMNKEGLSKKNLIDFGFICVFTISLIFMFSFTIAYSNVYGGNNTLSTNVVNFTAVAVALGGGVVNEDMGHVYNISINASFGDSANNNITSVNITLPLVFNVSNNLYAVTSGSNGTGNITNNGNNGVDIWFNRTCSSTHCDGNTTGGYQVLSWRAGNSTKALFNATPVTGYFWFNATAWTPGKYNITVRVTYNETTAGVTTLVYNETNITIWVNDTTAPENVTFSGVDGLNRSVQDSATAILTQVGNYSGNLILNISTADNGNMVRNVYFNISYSNSTTNGTTWFFKATNATTSERYWNYTLDTHMLPDGFYNVTVWVNDTNGNLNKTVTINLTIDNTVPTGAMTCTPTSDVYIGQVVSCTCTSTDALTGVISTSYTASPSTTTSGTITQTCTFRDRAGNNGTATDTYIVWGSNDGGSSGGSSKTTTTSTTVSSFAQITSAAPVTATNFASGSGVKQIQIEVSQTATSVQITAQKYDTTPTAVSTSKTGTYKYFRVDTQNLANKLSKATMTIQVEKTWVSGQGIAKEDVALFKYDNASSQWNELTTTYSSEDNTYYYYTSDVSSFSYFAIAPKTVLTTGEPSTGDQQPSGEQNSTTTDTINLPYWVWVIVGVVILAVIVGVVVLTKKKR